MKFKYTIIFLIMTLSLNGVFANCTITPASFEQGSISCSPCNNETKICNCVINENIEVVQYALGVFFAFDNCEGYEINLLANNKNLIFKSGITMGSPNWNLIIQGTSKIYINSITSIDVNLSNIIIEPNAHLKIYNNSDYFVSSPISISFYAKDIIVNPNSILEINLKTNDGKIGASGTSEDTGEQDADPGISSGNLAFGINKIINYGNSQITLETGSGGNGGSAWPEDTADGDQTQDGENGGDSGNLNFNIKNIESYNDLIINLKTGNGGAGGHSCKDAGHDESFNGGTGGSSGNIIINSINEIYNEDKLNISAIAGNGGWAGTSRSGGVNDCDYGNNDAAQDHHGDSGNGGSISDLNISTLINKSNDLEIYMKSGELGKREVIDGTCTQYQLDKPFGKPGVLGNINIGFLENLNSGINITSKLNFNIEDYMLAATAQANNSTDDGGESGDTGYMLKLDDLGIKVTNVNINYLKNGSYLPNKIDIKNPQENILFDNFINITGCYIQPTQLDYQFNGATGVSASNIDFLRTAVPDYVGLTYKFCPHCEVIGFEDTTNRYTKQYNLYSNINGTINPGDLNIYYSDYNSQPNGIYYTKRTDGLQLPVYTNKNPIFGVLNTKINSYEYLINQEDLNWYSYDPEEDRDNLSSEADDYLFCYGEEYILEGKITTTSANKSFTFPFVPLREQFNN